MKDTASDFSQDNNSPDQKTSKPMTPNKNLLFSISAAIILVFIISLVLISSLTLKLQHQNNLSPKQNTSTTKFPTPTLSSISPTREYEEQLKTETKKQFNPSGTLAFYYTSEKPAFRPDYGNPYSSLNDDPFKICFNGDTYYFTNNIVQDRFKGEMPGYAYIAVPHILDVAQSKTYTLSIIGEDFSPNSCTRITRWTDDTDLMRKSCDGESGYCAYYLIDVHKNIAELIGTGGLSGAPWRVDFIKHPEYSEKGDVVENRVGKFLFAQYCDKDKKQVCESVLIFKDVPDYTLFPYSSYRSLAAITTRHEMKPIDFEEPENLASLGKKVKIHVGGGYFVFDLEQGKVIETNNL